MSRLKGIEDVTTDDVLEVLGDVDADTSDILKAATFYAVEPEQLTPAMTSRLIASLAHRLMKAEGNAAAPAPRAHRSPAGKPAAAEGRTYKMNQKAIDAGISPSYSVGDHVPVPCPACGKLTLVVKSTRDGSRMFIGCSQYPGCGGSISYKEEVK